MIWIALGVLTGLLLRSMSRIERLNECVDKLQSEARVAFDVVVRAPHQDPATDADLGEVLSIDCLKGVTLNSSWGSLLNRGWSIERALPPHSGLFLMTQQFTWLNVTWWAHLYFGSGRLNCLCLHEEPSPKSLTTPRSTLELLTGIFQAEPNAKHLPDPHRWEWTEGSVRFQLLSFQRMMFEVEWREATQQLKAPGTAGHTHVLRNHTTLNAIAHLRGEPQ